MASIARNELQQEFGYNDQEFAQLLESCALRKDRKSFKESEANRLREGKRLIDTEGYSFDKLQERFKNAQSTEEPNDSKPPYMELAATIGEAHANQLIEYTAESTVQYLGQKLRDGTYKTALRNAATRHISEGKLGEEMETIDIKTIEVETEAYLAQTNPPHLQALTGSSPNESPPS